MIGYMIKTKAAMMMKIGIVCHIANTPADQPVVTVAAAAVIAEG